MLRSLTLPNHFNAVRPNLTIGGITLKTFSVEFNFGPCWSSFRHFVKIAQRTTNWYPKSKSVEDDGSPTSKLYLYTHTRTQKQNAYGQIVTWWELNQYGTHTLVYPEDSGLNL